MNGIIIVMGILLISMMIHLLLRRNLAWITCIFLCSVSDIWYRTSYMIPEMRLCLHGQYPFSKFIQEVYIS